jgi:hypothetical protein
MAGRTFDQLIDFTRTTAGTYVDSTGKIVNTPASRNLLTFTQQFDNAAWTKTNATVIPNQNPAAATLGGELVTNGDFATDTVWTKGDGWTITGGLAVRSPAAFGSELTQPISLVAGRLYRVEYTISAHSAQSVRLQFNGGTTVLGTLRAANGTYVEYLTAVSGNNTLSFACGAAAASLSIDNVSVREVIGGWNVAPDGTSTADTLLATAGTGFVPRVFQTPSTVTSTVYTASYYVRPGTHTFVQIYMISQTSDFCNFTLTGNGSVQNNGAAVGTITFDSATGWYRISMTYTAGGTNRYPVLTIAPSGTATYAQSWNPVGTESILIWGSQFEVGSLTTYTRNVGGVFPARFDYDPVTLAPRGLLIEEQRVNLVTYSEQFDDAAWTKSSSTITANASVSPDGTADADKVIVNNGTNLGSGSAAGVRQDISKAASAITYTLSVYAKAAELNSVTLFLSNLASSASYRATFNLSAGTVGSPTTVGAFVGGGAFIFPAGNGWYRCVLIATSDTDTTLRSSAWPFDTVKTQGNGSDGIFLWGAQLEAGAFATSYIPTVASQVTRAADVAAITGPNFTQFYNQSEGTWVVELQKLSPSSTATYGVEVTGASSNFSMRVRLGTDARLQSVDGGVAVVDAQLAASVPTTVSKYGIAYKLNDYAGSAGGAAAVTDTSATVPALSALSIGSAGVTNIYVRSIRFYPSRLTNAQLVSLTA